MPRFAKETTVPVERSRAEIEATLVRYGATEFNSGWKPGAAMVMFRINNLCIRFILPIPEKNEERFHWRTDRGGYRKRNTEAQALGLWDQEIRQRWRNLLLNIHGKLAAIDCGISTIEQEFLANIVMPNDVSVGEWFLGSMLPQIARGEMPRLMLAAPPREEVTDAEFEVKTSGQG